MATYNVTLSDKNIVLAPQADWNHTASTWFSFDLGANVTATLPANATAVYWVGQQRPGAGFYSLCLDCSEHDIIISNNSVVQWIDGHQPSGLDVEAPQILWFMNNLTSPTNTSHTVRIVNQIDNRFKIAGQINIDALIVSLPNATSLPANTSTAAAPQSTHKHVSKTVLIAAILAGAEALLLIVLLILYFRKRRKSRNGFTMANGRDKEADIEGSTSCLPGRNDGDHSMDYDPSEALEHPTDMPNLGGGGIPKSPRDHIPSPSPITRALASMFTSSISRSVSPVGRTSPSPSNALEVSSQPAASPKMLSFFDWETTPSAPKATETSFPHSIFSRRPPNAEVRGLDPASARSGLLPSGDAHHAVQSTSGSRASSFKAVVTE